MMVVKELIDLLSQHNPNIEIGVSVDVSTCEEDAENRVFSDDIFSVQSDETFASILCEEGYANHTSEAEKHFYTEYEKLKKERDMYRDALINLANVEKTPRAVGERIELAEQISKEMRAVNNMDPEIAEVVDEKFWEILGDSV